MKKLFFILLLSLVALPAFGQVPYRSFDLCNGYVARSTSGSCSAVDTMADEVAYRATTARVYIDVSAVSGTSPTLVIRLMGLAGPFGVVFKVCESSSISAIGQYSFTCDYLPDTIVADALLGGTSPNFTYAVYLVRQ